MGNMFWSEATTDGNPIDLGLIGRKEAGIMVTEIMRSQGWGQIRIDDYETGAYTVWVDYDGADADDVSEEGQ